MDRRKMIVLLKLTSPKIISIGFSDDMGFEFTAITSEGIILQNPACS